MDLMGLRRGLLMMASGNNVQMKQGTFVGTGNQYQTINCPFEPDVILVECPAAKSSNIGMGIIDLVSVKWFGASSIDWTSDTATDMASGSPVTYLNPNWSTVWSYSNGQMTFGRAPTYARYRFISNATYNYTFIKYTE